jgi:hypothetical protein
MFSIRLPNNLPEEEVDFGFGKMPENMICVLVQSRR